VAYRLAYDYDGRVHYSGDERQHARDMARVISLAEAGWTLRVVTARDLAHGSRQLLNAARRLLVERGAAL
jgi:very-short-patch-repair endonuclease